MSYGNTKDTHWGNCLLAMAQSIDLIQQCFHSIDGITNYYIFLPDIAEQSINIFAICHKSEVSKSYKYILQKYMQIWLRCNRIYILDK